jgi:hypothetical protein
LRYDCATIALRSHYDCATIALRSRYDRATLALRSRYDRATIALRSRYDRATIALQSRYDFALTLPCITYDINLTLYSISHFFPSCVELQQTEREEKESEHHAITKDRSDKNDKERAMTPLCESTESPEVSESFSQNTADSDELLVQTTPMSLIIQSKLQMLIVAGISSRSCSVGGVVIDGVGGDIAVLVMALAIAIAISLLQ